MSNIISPTRTREYLLELAKKKRAHKFTRVSQATINEVESNARALCLRIVESRPSVGTTL